MRISFLLLFFYLFSSTAISQNCILTRNCDLANKKNELTSIKILLEVYDDSLVNKMLLGELYLPGPIKVIYDEHLQVKDILYTEIYEKWTNELKRRFSRSIRKHMYFLSSPDLKYLTDTDIKQGATGGVFIYPFSLRGGYMILMGKVNYFQTRKKQKKYQIVDYAKGLIEKYNKVGIKDLDGNVYY